VLDGDGRVLELRLTGDRVDHRIGDGANARIGRKRAIPVDGREHHARRNIRPGAHAHHDRAPARSQRGQLTIANSEAQRIGDVDLGIGLGHVRRKARGLPGTRHGVPVIAHAPGIEYQREFFRGGVYGQTRRQRDEARLAVGVLESSVGKHRPAC
jgi:hypothetical protein